MTGLETADLICSIIDEKKGKDIVKIEVADISSICDYFVIASGNSVASVKAIAEHIDEKLGGNEIFAKRVEGLSEGRWVAMDYGDVIVHIFNDETRLFYHLEKLWEEGKAFEFNKPVKETKKAPKIKAAPKTEKEDKVKKEKPVKEKESKVKVKETDKVKPVKEKEPKVKVKEAEKVKPAKEKKK